VFETRRAERGKKRKKIKGQNIKGKRTAPTQREIQTHQGQNRKEEKKGRRRRRKRGRSNKKKG
jgi:hypothetical protein